MVMSAGASSISPSRRLTLTEAVELRQKTLAVFSSTPLQPSAGRANSR